MGEHEKCHDPNCNGEIKFYQEGELYTDYDYYKCNKCGKTYIWFYGENECEEFE